MKEQESTKMEFLLTLNDNIVVQRFFNVRGYVPKAKNSMELHYFIKALSEELHYLIIDYLETLLVHRHCRK